MILSAIAAMAHNRVIGKNNQLPWHLPEDMKYFRDQTKGKIMIMGRKTFESFSGKPLPNRFHIVITRQKDYLLDHPMVKIVSDLNSAIAVAKELTPKFGEEVFVIGGAEIYQQSIPLLDRLYLTVIDKDFEGDALFPDFSSEKLILKTEEKKISESGISFSFCLFGRV